MRFVKNFRWLVVCALAGLATVQATAVERIRRVAVTNYTGYVIEADTLVALPGYNRDRIRSELIVESDNSAAGTGRLYTNVLTVRLIDTDGNPQPLIASGVTNTSVLLSNVINGPAGSVIQTTNTITLQLATRLDAYSPYRVQLTVTGPFAPPGTTSNSVPQLYKHFTNVVNNDPALNIISEAGDPTWTRYTAVVTDTNRNGFIANVPFTLYRFDGFSNSPPATNLVGVRLNYELRSMSNNTVVPLTVSQAVVFVSVPSYQGAAPREPAVVNASNQLVLIPAPGVQLDAINDQYRLSVQISHTNIPSGPLVAGNIGRAASSRLYHYSGRLTFGPIETWFSQLNDDPYIVPYVGSPSQIATILYVINPARSPARRGAPMGTTNVSAFICRRTARACSPRTTFHFRVRRMFAAWRSRRRPSMRDRSTA